MQKIALLQLNATVGALEKNAQQLVSFYERAVAQGAELVVAPELSLCGYPPRDLLHKERFLEDCEVVLSQLASKVGEVALIVGAPARAEEGVGQLVTNSAFVLQKGRIIARQDKVLLPNYDVFEEQRYFRPAKASQVVQIGETKVGITICEDIWSEEYLPVPLYYRSPPMDLAAQGAKLIVNLSASPFSLGKPQRRGGMISELAARLEIPLVYCNAVGGNDQLIFDGHSAGFDSIGRCVGQAKGFEEDLLVVDIRGLEQRVEAEEDCEQLHKALVLGLRDYVRKCGFDEVILGLSGGIDSALCATLAVDALGADKVHGVLMPSPYSSEHSLSDARALCENLGIQGRTIAIEPMMQAVEGQLAGVFEGLEADVTEENIQSRLRGLILMSLSNKFGSLLLTTGNKSELAVGYCTIYGDMCGGLAVIADVPKTKVFALAKYLNLEKERIPFNTIDKPPSAELRPDQQDSDSLPEYAILDEILEAYIEKNWSVARIVEEGIADEELARWVATRVDLNEWKRQQAPPGLRVTSRAFGMGRRLPIAQGYVGR